jgi:hypothetical protein
VFDRINKQNEYYKLQEYLESLKEYERYTVDLEIGEHAKQIGN